MSSTQLADRMAQANRAQLRELGFESVEQLTAMRDRDAAAVTAAEEARRATLSREQTLQEDVTARTAERDTFEAERDDLRFQSHVSTICATMGVKNVGYAQHLIEQQAAGMGENEELDVQAFLAERVDPGNGQHAANRAALGLEAPVVTTPVPFTNTGDDPPPTPPPAGGGNPTGFDAMNADPAAWAAKKEQLGI